MKLYVHLMYYDARIAPEEFSVMRTGLSGEIIEVDIGELFDRRLEAALKRAAEERTNPSDLDAPPRSKNDYSKIPPKGLTKP